MLERRISASLLRMRAREPFFATLSLHARFVPDSSIPTACTDGRDVRYNPHFLEPLSDPELDAILLHEVLHAALLHIARRGEREPVRWNLAADIVVNGVVASRPGYELPRGTLREPELEHLSVEEIYELLEARPETRCEVCLQPRIGPGEPGWRKRVLEMEAYWRNALRKAETVARASGQGSLPAGFERWVSEASPQLSWRALLWRYLVRTPHDFTGFDRRFVHQGWYLDALDGERVEVCVAIDTSGSISNPQLSAFLGELRGILGSYPHLKAELYYADAALYGPWSLERSDLPPPPVGGGGTSFVPVFEALHSASSETVCVYLTDGFGTFPEEVPRQSVLWVVTPGGRRADAFPFGEVVYLVG